MSEFDDIFGELIELEDCSVDVSDIDDALKQLLELSASTGNDDYLANLMSEFNINEEKKIVEDEKEISSSSSDENSTNNSQEENTQKSCEEIGESEEEDEHEKNDKNEEKLQNHEINSEIVVENFQIENEITQISISSNEISPITSIEINKEKNEENNVIQQKIIEVEEDKDEYEDKDDKDDDLEDLLNELRVPDLEKDQIHFPNSPKNNNHFNEESDDSLDDICREMGLDNSPSYSKKDNKITDNINDNDNNINNDINNNNNNNNNNNVNVNVGNEEKIEKEKKKKRATEGENSLEDSERKKKRKEKQKKAENETEKQEQNSSEDNNEKTKEKRKSKKEKDGDKKLKRKERKTKRSLSSISRSSELNDSRETSPVKLSTSTSNDSLNNKIIKSTGDITKSDENNNQLNQNEEVLTQSSERVLSDGEGEGKFDSSHNNINNNHKKGEKGGIIANLFSKNTKKKDKSKEDSSKINVNNIFKKISGKVEMEIEDPSKHRRSTITLQEMAFKVHMLKENSYQKSMKIKEFLLKLSEENCKEEQLKIENEITRIEKDILHDDMLIGSLELNIDSALKREKSDFNSSVGNTLDMIDETMKPTPKGKIDHKKSSSKPVVVLSSFSELPAEIQTKIKEIGIETNLIENNFELLLKIINFNEGTQFYTPKQKRVYDLTKKIQIRPPLYGRITKPYNYYMANLTGVVASKLYKPIKHEGKGGFGRVYYAKDKKKGHKVAIKKVKCNTAKLMKECSKEVSYLQFCQHRNIISYVDFLIDDETAWIVMEFMDGGTISQALEVTSLEEGHIAYITDQVLLALKYLHSNEIVHRDVKGANIMMSAVGEVKLIDFGLCVDLKEVNFMSQFKYAGTSYYMPPEMITSFEIGPWCDIWSLGISLLEMANGSLPFDDPIKTMFSVCSNSYGKFSSLLKNPERWSEGFVHFLDSCLQFDHLKRPTASDLLNSHWLKETVCDEEDISDIVGVVWTKQYACF